MKKIFTLLTILVLTISVRAQSTLVASNAALVSEETPKTATILLDEVLVLKEMEFNFGKIPQGKPVTHIFEVTNNGKDSLHIVNVQASCGCTTPEWDREKVQAPGEKTKITVGYNAASEGPFTKQITITYNGTQTKQILIKGEVWKTPVTSAPENKELGNLKD
ncbi:MAG: DUF1573 domain-containing protein [Ferruginibacter sp.]|nr:DUF1573 domain-containing protein [Ferruginibacter sp.]